MFWKTRPEPTPKFPFDEVEAQAILALRAGKPELMLDIETLVEMGRESQEAGVAFTDWLRRR